MAAGEAQGRGSFYANALREKVGKKEYRLFVLNKMSIMSDKG